MNPYSEVILLFPAEAVLLLPKEVVREYMRTRQDIIGLMNMSVNVINRAYNNFGLLYLVEGRACDIQALIDLGFMEWV